MTDSRAGWTSPGIVLRTTPVGESDLMVTLLTSARGRVDAAARGARKSRVRFPGGLPVGARGEVRVRPGRGVRPTLEGFDPSFDHAAIGRDVERFGFVAYLCEITEQLVLGDGADASIFAGLSRALGSTIEGAPSAAVLRAYELELLDHLGLLPSLERCCVCGAPAAPETEGAGVTRLAFEVARGGVLCGTHARPGGGSMAVDVVEAARRLRSWDLDALEGAPAATRRGVRDLCLQVVRQNLLRPLKSAERCSHARR